MKPLLLSLLFAVLLAPLAPVHAGEPVGMVKTVSGEATLTHRGQSVAARVGAPVFEGSQLKTAAGGSLGITFNDNTVMSFGPDTEITIDAFLYAPSQGKLKLETSISRGTLEYVSGVIAKLRPKAVAIKTPTGTIGVRGTHFVVKVDD